MSSVSRRDCSWKRDELWLGTQNTGYSVVPEIVYTFQMWRIKMPDGRKSADYYNRTRAVDLAVFLCNKEQRDETKLT